MALTDAMLGLHCRESYAAHASLTYQISCRAHIDAMFCVSNQIHLTVFSMTGIAVVVQPVIVSWRINNPLPISNLALI